MLRRPPRSTRLTHSFPTRRSSDLAREGVDRLRDGVEDRGHHVGDRRARIFHEKGVGPADQHEAKGRADQQKQSEARSEEHTSELQSLMRISYAVFCLKKKKQPQEN